MRRRARTLDERLLRPLRAALGNTSKLLIAPDGALNLIPFAALVDEQGRYQIERFAITYLTSGRDLLRLTHPAASRAAPLIMAAPQFDLTPTKPTPPAQNDPAASRAATRADMHFAPLAGTVDEARALARLLPQARVLVGAEATESALKRVTGPVFLHVATHGFFLADSAAPVMPATRGLTLAGDRTNTPAATNVVASLLRSGLALAGANGRADGAGEDGILTALEASGLDLWGTRLVVLSACETGLGAVATGEGVYGLRRALVLAGSESQVMSLWQVSDAATRDLMVAYYKRLQAGEGRTEALRQVQLAMLHGRATNTTDVNRGLTDTFNPLPLQTDRSHPFFWASFIQSGAWQPLERK